MDSFILLVVSELVLFAVLLWFVRYSNQRTMREIVNLEAELKQFNEFLAKLGKSHKKIKEQVSLLNSITTDFGIAPEKNGSMEKEKSGSRSGETAVVAIATQNKK